MCSKRHTNWISEIVISGSPRPQNAISRTQSAYLQALRTGIKIVSLNPPLTCQFIHLQIGSRRSPDNWKHWSASVRMRAEDIWTTYEAPSHITLSGHPRLPYHDRVDKVPHNAGEVDDWMVWVLRVCFCPHQLQIHLHRPENLFELFLFKYGRMQGCRET